MTLLPIVSRELLAQSRKQGTYWTRILAAGVAGLIMLWMLFISTAAIPLASQGRGLFLTLSLIAFIYCLLAGPLLTADCISWEKRDGTLGLLFLTDLRGFDIVLGKLVSSSVHILYALLGIVPILALATLFGGVTAAEITRVACVLANTMFFSLAAGVFVSTLSRNDRKAVFATVVLLAVIAVAPYLTGFAATNGFATAGSLQDAEPFLVPSPIFAFSLVHQPTLPKLKLPLFYESLAWTHGIAWALLILASVAAPYTWKDRPPMRAQERWGERWRRFAFGSAAVRRNFRRQALNRNPFLWLSARERRRALLPWVLILPLAAIGAWVLIFWPIGFYESSLVLLGVIHVMLKLWFTGEVCNRWIEDRRSGALELILCTPVRTRELLRGQEIALWRQFGAPVIATILLGAATHLAIAQTSGLGSSTASGRSWILVSIAALAADLVALRWVAMWNALTARGLNRAIAKTVAQVLGLRWLVYLLLCGVLAVWAWMGFGIPRFLSGLTFWLVLALVFDALFILYTRREFHRYFRAIISSPSDYRLAPEAKTSPVAAVGEAADHAAPSVSDALRIPAMQPHWRLDRGMKLALASFAFLLLAIALQGGYRFWQTKKVEQRLALLQQAGEPIRVADLERLRPAVPDAENVAWVLARAFPLLTNWHYTPHPVRRKLPNWSPSASKGGLVPGEPIAPDVKEAITLVLARNQPILDVLHETKSLRKGCYAMDWREEDENLIGRQSTALWIIAELLRLEVLARADSGDLNGALHSLHRLFDLGHSLDTEPGTLHTVRTMTFLRAIDTMEWVLSHHLVPTSELTQFITQLRDVEQRTDLRAAILAWRCLAIEHLLSPKTRHRPLPFGSPLPQALQILRRETQGRIRRWTAANERDLLRMLDWSSEFLRVADLPFPERLERAREFPSDVTPVSVDFLHGLFHPASLVDQVVLPTAEFIAYSRVTLASLAVEHYRRHSGGLPNSLDDLSGFIAPEILRDPFDGRPLRYRKLAPRGFVVYSVGRDGKDDLGTPQGQGASSGSPLFGRDITFTVAR